MKRYYIVEGDQTTVGGVVQKHTGAGSTTSWHGKVVSNIGDKVACPACKSVGVIQAVGSRLPFGNKGYTPAMNDDICVCKCSPPPKLIHSQTIFSQKTDDSSESLLDSYNKLSSLNQSQNLSNNWIRYKLNDGFDYQGMPCTLYFKSGLKLESVVSKDNILEFKGFEDDDFDYLHFSELSDINDETCFSDILLKRI